MSSSEFDAFDATATGVTASEMLATGVRLAGRYRIDGVLGVGGMGVVYRALDEQLDIPVALKVLRAERRLDEKSLARFRQEILLARKVSHPAVVRLHDLGIDGDIVFLTMDCVEGRTLRDRIAEGPLDVRRTLEIARQLAEGLAAAHDVGVIHRDLKPANVLIADDGRAWLTDFGVARAVGASAFTGEGMIAGTPDYLSPEQIRGETVDGRTDIYALGLIIYEMLTAEVPLRGESLTETAARRAAGVEANFAKLQAAPAGVRRIVERCLAPSLDDRYGDADALAEDLARGRAELVLRRNTRRAIAGVGALIAVAVVFGVFLNRPSQQEANASAQSDAEIASVNAAASEETARSLRVAVLPFENLTGDAEFDWVRRGLSQTFSQSLAESPELQLIDNLRVLRTIDALRLQESALDQGAMRQLAALLEADRIISGRLIGEEGARRLEFTIRNAPGGEEQRFQAPVADEGLLAAADDGVTQLREGLKAKPVAEAAGIAFSDNSEAMAFYDEGVSLLARGDSLGAIGPLKSAVDLDPAFGAGWNALATALGETGRRPEALDAAERAVDILAVAGGRSALLARAQRAVLVGDPETGFSLYDQLVEQYPNDDEARVQLATELGEHGKYSEAIEHLKVVVENDPNHPRAWYLLGRYAVLSGGARLAVDEYLVRALLIQNRVGSAQGRADVFNTMGLAHDRLGELDIARQHYRNAAEIRDQAGDRRGYARSVTNIARLDMIQGDFASAREELARSLEVMETAGDAADVADLRNEFGVLEEEAGDYEAALGHYREALRLRRELGGAGGLAESYNNLAFTYLVLGEFDNAAAFARDAKAEYAAANDRHGEMTVLEIEGELALAAADWEAALQAYVSELEISRSLSSPFSEAVAEGGIGLVAHYQGRPGAALAAYQRALDILEPLNDQRGAMEFTLRRAALLVDIAAPAAAAAELDKVAAYADESNFGQRAEYYRLRGAVAAMNGDASDLQASLDRAADFAARSNSKALQLKVDIERLHRLTPGDVAQAQSLADRAARFAHAPLRALATEYLADAKLRAGDEEGALAAARSALRAPLRIDPWIASWRLHRLVGAASEGQQREEALARSADALAALIDATPAPLRDGLRTAGEAAGLDVATR